MNKLGRLFKDKSLFLNIDIQERFRTMNHYYPNVVGVGQLMMRASKHLQIPVIVTEQVRKVFLRTDKAILDHVHDKVSIFEKSQFSAFKDEAVKQKILQLAPKSIVVYGIQSHICVQQTVLDLLEANYDVHVVSDGVSSDLNIDRSVSLLKMTRAGAYITSSESLLFEYLGDFKGQLFKSVLPLFKEKNAPNSKMQPLEWPNVFPK
jgi:isochorismate hydrolase